MHRHLPKRYPICLLLTLTTFYVSTLLSDFRWIKSKSSKRGRSLFSDIQQTYSDFACCIASFYEPYAVMNLKLEHFPCFDHKIRRWNISLTMSHTKKCGVERFVSDFVSQRDVLMSLELPFDNLQVSSEIFSVGLNPESSYSLFNVAVDIIPQGVDILCTIILITSRSILVHIF